MYEWNGGSADMQEGQPAWDYTWSKRRGESKVQGAFFLVCLFVCQKRRVAVGVGVEVGSSSGVVGCSSRSAARKKPGDPR